MTAMSNAIVRHTGRLLLAALALLGGFVPVQAQDQVPATGTELENFCRSAACRRDVTVSVRLADGRVQHEHLPLYRPAIHRSSVSVLLGESIEAVPDFDDDDVFQGWRAPGRRESSRTPQLTFKLSQSEGDGSIAASIANAGRDPVKLRLYIRDSGATEAEYTSSCPVIAGGGVYEYWTRPVAEMIVREATLLTDDAALLCD